MNELQKAHENRPPQHQERQPGREYKMDPQPIFIRDHYQGSDKLKGKVALISGGDSGIGRSIAIHFAREGADVAILYLEEDQDAATTKSLVEQEKRRCLCLKHDVSDAAKCGAAVEETLEHFGGLNILVNNAARQEPQDDLTDISPDQLRRTFETNLFGYFYLAQAALPHLSEGDSILNCASVTAYRGSSHLIDYSATKGAITSFTRSLASSVADRGIRVNAVAPGPIWTPLIPATFPAERVADFGDDTLLQRAGQPCEVATAFVFLASEDASYFTGQVLHPNGGDFVHS